MFIFIIYLGSIYLDAREVRFFLDMENDLANKQCRVCLQEGRNNIFTKSYQGITLLEIFTTTTKFRIRPSDGLSHFLCRNCTKIIADFYNLKLLYKENEKNLRASLPLVRSITKEHDSLSETFSHVPKQEEHIATDNVGVKHEIGQEYGIDEEIKVEVEIHTNESEPTEFSIVDSSCGALQADEVCSSKKDLKKGSELGLDTNKKFKNMPCSICQEVFNCHQDLKEHKKIHKQNICHICGSAYCKKWDLTEHLKLQHSTNVERHVCEICKKEFRSRKYWKIHRRLHTNARQHVCHICGKSFNVQGTLKSHIKLCHTSIREYVCTFCNAQFNLKTTLVRHLQRRHQQRERTLQCKECPLAYKDKKCLENHVYKKHSGRFVRPSCDLCGKVYSSLAHLNRHQKVSHERLDFDGE